MVISVFYGRSSMRRLVVGLGLLVLVGCSSHGVVGRWAAEAAPEGATNWVANFRPDGTVGVAYDMRQMVETGTGANTVRHETEGKWSELDGGRVALAMKYENKEQHATGRMMSADKMVL